MAVNR